MDVDNSRNMCVYIRYANNYLESAHNRCIYQSQQPLLMILLLLGAVEDCQTL